MKLRKMNISPWLMLGMMAVLMTACLVAVAAPALARYQTKSDATTQLQARPLEQIYLGQMVPGTNENDEKAFDQKIFDHESQGKWYSLDGVMMLEFAIANGKYQDVVDEQTGETTVEALFAEQDQRAIVRLVASPLVWDGTEELLLTLRAPSRTKTGEFEEFKAVPERIHPDSILYQNFGPGWNISFVDEYGQELSWLLKGGELSSVELELILEGVPAGETGLLKLQVISDYTRN